MNEVEIHVSWKDDNGKALGELKAKAKKAGGDAGDDWSGSFSGSLSKGATKAVEKTAKDVAAKSKPAFEKAGDEAGKSTAKGFEKGAKDVDKATEKVAQRTQAQFKAMQFAGAFAGLPAAAIAASVIAGGALAAVPLAAAAGAALLIHSNAQVNESFVQLGNHAQEMATRAAQPMKNDLVQAMHQVDTAAQGLEPQLTQLFTVSGAPMLTFTSGVTKLVQNAMPGLVTAAENSQGPMRGLSSLLSDAGAGVSDFFSNASKGATGAEAGLVSTGGIIRDLTGFAGTLMANLANGASSALPQFRAALGQVEGVVLSLSSGGMPALQGATSGFLHTVGGALGVVQGFAGMLGSWAQPLGSLGGSLFATNKLAGMFGTSLGETGFGLKAFSGTVDEAGKKTTPFKTALADAEKSGTSKLKAGLNSVVSSGLNPLGIVLGIGSIALDMYGESQQKAAQYAAEHKDNVRALTDAVRADAGAMGDATQNANSKALADKNASANLAAFGQNIGTATEAIKGNGYAYDALKFSAGATLATIADASGITGDNREALIKLGATSLDTGKNFDQLKNDVLATGITYDSSGESAQRLGGAQLSLVEQLINGTGAVGEQVRATREAHDAYIETEHALTGLTRAQIENRDATAKATQAIYEQQNAQLGYRGAVQNTDQALDNYAKTSKSGKATEDQKAAALLKVEEAFASQEQAAYKAAYANSTAKLESDRLNDAMVAQNRETVSLANSFSGALPQSISQTIGKFSVAQAQAAGLTVGIDATGQAVYRLPNGKEIRITADTSGARDAVNGIVRDINNRVATIQVRTSTGYSNIGIGTGGRGSLAASGGLITPGGVQRFAKGGQAYAGGDMVDVGPGGLLSGPGSGTSDDIVARVSNGEFVVKASQTRKNLPLLKAINNGQDGFAGGGRVQAEDGTWVPSSFYGGAPKGPHAGGWQDTSSARSAAGSRGGGTQVVKLEVASGGSTLEQLLAEFIRNYVRVQGGDVQTVFGR